MKRIWAPWRMEYIRKAGKGGGCFFCGALRGRADRKNLLLLRGKTCLAMLNLFPYNNGHLLIAPRAHKGRLTALSKTERAELFDLTVRMQKVLERALRPDGFNIGINLGRVAGAGVPGHVHQHIVPRWNGDTNFMPAVGATKVMPQALEDLFDRLQKVLRASRSYKSR